MDWAPTYMFEVQKATISTAAYKAMAIPIAGSLGAIFAGWISDRYFSSKRAPIAVIMLVFLTLTCWIYPRIPVHNWVLSLIALMFIGFLTYGPHVLMCGTMAMDFGTRKAASSAAGFIDSWGYLGASLTGIGTGWLIDKYNWQAAFDFWLCGALGAVIFMGLLWNYKPEARKYH
jgi:OPA family glycerol-3-phosphate transporter-like MFS transporter